MEAINTGNPFFPGGPVIPWKKKYEEKKREEKNTNLNKTNNSNNNNETSVQQIVAQKSCYTSWIIKLLMKSQNQH